jgi:hypothetical protein
MPVRRSGILANQPNRETSQDVEAGRHAVRILMSDLQATTDRTDGHPVTTVP